MSASDGGSGVIACSRCKTRKIKCDRGMPKCSNCERSGKPCLMTDPATGRQVPRSYLTHLEARVKQLEFELETARQVTATSIPAYAWLPEAELPYHGESSGFSMAARLAQEINERLTNGITFDNFNTLYNTGEPFKPLPKDLWCLPTNLPRKSEAESLVKWYFEQCNSTYPVLHREQFIKNYFEPVYGPVSPDLKICSDYTEMDLKRSSTEPGTGTFYRRWVDCGNSIAASPEPRIQYCLFFLFMVFALSIVSVNRIASEHPEKGPQYLSAAMNYYSVTASGHSREEQLRCIQAILLLSVYGVLMPMSSSAWFTVGNAMRMCVHMGFHNEANLEGCDEYTIDMRRRLFWVTYYLDRMVSLNLGRPVTLAEEFCTCPLPSMLDDAFIKPTGVPLSNATTIGVFESKPPQPQSGDTEAPGMPRTKASIYDRFKMTEKPSETRPSYKWIFRYMLDLRRLQQRTKYMLYDKPAPERRVRTEAGVIPDINPEMVAKCRKERDILDRELFEWRDSLVTSPRNYNFDWDMKMFDVNFNFTRVVTHRNSAGIPEPNLEEGKIVVESGIEMLRTYVGFLKDLYFVYTWSAVHNILQASTSIIYVLFQTNGLNHTFDFDSFEHLMKSVLEVMRQLEKSCKAVGHSCMTMERLVEYSLSSLRDTHKRARSELPDGLESAAKRPALDPSSISMAIQTPLGAQGGTPRPVLPHISDLGKPDVKQQTPARSSSEIIEDLKNVSVLGARLDKSSM